MKKGPRRFSWAFVRTLPVKHGDSIKLSLEIPVVFTNNPKGAKHISISRDRLPYYLDLKQLDLDALRRSGLIEQDAIVRAPKPRIDYPKLAGEYLQKLKKGECSSRSELARNLGVSRAWISKVLRKGLMQHSDVAG